VKTRVVMSKNAALYCNGKPYALYFTKAIYSVG